MIWNGIELFNVEWADERKDGAVRLMRFPREVMNVFGEGKRIYPMTVGRMAAGCEIRLVTEAADILITAEDADGVIEIFRGDFLCKTVTLKAGVETNIPLRREAYFQDYDMSALRGRFDRDVWRIVFANDFCAVVNDINPIREVRPPRKEEVPQTKILAYGSSITQGAGAGPHSHSYLATVGRLLGADTLCKGMGGSCFCEKEVGDYVASADWDIAILEMGVNMVGGFDVETYEKRAEYIVEKALTKNKPVVMISHFAHYNDLPGAVLGEKNQEYITAYERIYEKLKCDNLYYINGREIVADLGWLTADMIHPSPFGHNEMGRRIACILRDKFGII